MDKKLFKIVMLFYKELEIIILWENKTDEEEIEVES